MQCFLNIKSADTESRVSGYFNSFAFKCALKGKRKKSNDSQTARSLNKQSMSRRCYTRTLLGALKFTNHAHPERLWQWKYNINRL